MHWVAEARSHRVICLVLGIWLLNGFDLAFTILSHEQGVLHEENPVAGCRRLAWNALTARRIASGRTSCPKTGGKSTAFIGLPFTE